MPGGSSIPASPLMKFRSIHFFLAAFGMLLSFVSARAAESYIAVEAHSGKILLELDADRRRPVASLTKMATAMVVLDWAGLTKTSMGTITVVPQEAAVLGGSNPMGLLPGDQITLREAMYSTMLGSDNVSAFTLAYHVGYSIQARAGGRDPITAFVREMNNLAANLGMKGTRFGNPHGMDAAGTRGYSTARDMARLSIYAMRDTGLQFYVKQKVRTISSTRGGEVRAFKVSNTHALLGRQGVNGIKTGTTQLAGQCAATSAEKANIVKKLGDGSSSLTGRRLIMVVLGSADRWATTQVLLNQGWPLYETWRQAGRPVTSARELLVVPQL